MGPTSKDRESGADDKAASKIGKLRRLIGGELDWQRIALTEEQVEQYNLAPVQIMKPDRRYRAMGLDRGRDTLARRPYRLAQPRDVGHHDGGAHPT